MISQQITPPEANIIAAESPFRVRRLVDMFLSQGDFDPNLLQKNDAIFYESLEKRSSDISKLRREAEKAREQANRAVIRTNDITETIRRIRGQ